MDSEFPGVIDLNVSGTPIRVLLSTLTKDEDSELAAMFTGRSPVYKDKDGRFFIEANPTSFPAILHFLLYDELPFHDTESTRSGGFFLGGIKRRQALFGSEYNLSSRDIELMYRDSLNLGLKRLSEALILFQPNFMNSKMNEYRKTIPGYDKTMEAILDIVPAETLFHNAVFTVRIKQDLQRIEDEKCCQHVCKTLNSISFNDLQYSRSINAIVKVHFDVNPTILSVFAMDFKKRGYSVQGSLEMCEFECNKDVKQSKYIVFGNQRKHCCTEELFLLNFRWDIETHEARQPGVFGVKDPTFANVQPNTGFTFGGNEQKQTNTGLFGNTQQANFGFASTQKQQHGTMFGKSTGFGSAQQQVPGSGFSFGGFGGVMQQGAESGCQHSGSFGQSQSFGKSTESQPKQSLFGSFGQSQSFGKSTEPQPQQSLFGSFGQSQSFGKSAEPQPQQSLFDQASQQQGSCLFGSSALNNQQSMAAAGKSVFGGNQNLTFGQNMQEKGSGAAFSFSSPQKQSTTVGQSIFGKSLGKGQPIFGGKPVFQSSFASPLQTTVNVSPGTFVAKTTAEEKNSFGKPSSTAAIIRSGESTTSSESS